jgi:hypothetical protein
MAGGWALSVRALGCLTRQGAIELARATPHPPSASAPFPGFSFRLQLRPYGHGKSIVFEFECASGYVKRPPSDHAES